MVPTSVIHTILAPRPEGPGLDGPAWLPGGGAGLAGGGGDRGFTGGGGLAGGGGGRGLAGGGCLYMIETNRTTALIIAKCP